MFTVFIEVLEEEVYYEVFKDNTEISHGYIPVINGGNSDDIVSHLIKIFGGARITVKLP